MIDDGDISNVFSDNEKIFITVFHMILITLIRLKRKLTREYYLIKI